MKQEFVPARSLQFSGIPERGSAIFEAAAISTKIQEKVNFSRVHFFLDQRRG